MQDLSGLLPGDPVTAIAPTSQAGGNMMSSNRQAMSAPGSLPTDPLPPEKEQGDPEITASNGPSVTKGGKDRHPGSYSPSAPAWKNTH